MARKRYSAEQIIGYLCEAAEIALAGGLELVMDKCIKIEHARFHGGLHLAGFDTGVIDSRRRKK